MMSKLRNVIRDAKSSLSRSRTQKRIERMNTKKSENNVFYTQQDPASVPKTNHEFESTCTPKNIGELYVVGEPYPIGNVHVDMNQSQATTQQPVRRRQVYGVLQSSEKDQTIEKEKSVWPPESVSDMKPTAAPIVKPASYKKPYSNGSATPKSSYPNSYTTYQASTLVPKKVKLTIILLENTTIMFNEMERMRNFINSLETSGFVALINYGSRVLSIPRMKVEEFKKLVNTIRTSDDKEPVKNDSFLFDSNLSDDACLYDALQELAKNVKDNYDVSFWSGLKQYKIESIEIFGFGRCIDTCSKASFEKAIKDFEEVAKRKNVATKYLCLTEESFKNAAIIGFRSIGAMIRKTMVARSE